MRHTLGAFLSIFLVFIGLTTNADNEYRFRHFKVENGLASNSIRSIVQDKYGFLWFATDDGLNRYDGYSIKNITSNLNELSKSGNHYINSIMEDSQGRLWIGSDEGVCLYSYENDNFQWFDIATERGIKITSIVNNIIEDKQQNVWISTYGQGCFKYNLATQNLCQYQLPIEPKSLVNYIYADSEDNIWAASRNTTFPLATFDADADSFKIFNININCTDIENTLLTIYEDSTGLWLGTWSDGIRLLDRNTGNTRTYLSPRNGGGVMQVRCISKNADGRLLIGSDDGLTIFDQKTGYYEQLKTDNTNPASISDNYIYAIIKDHEDGIWVGTNYGGVNYLPFNNNTFKGYTHSLFRNSVTGNIINCFCEDEDGIIWIGTDNGGLNQFDPKTEHFTAFLPGRGNSISYHNVNALCADGDLLWIGTYSGGIDTYNRKSGEFRHYQHNKLKINSIDNNSIYSIFRDNSGNIWAASINGINLYNRQTDDFKRIKHFGYATTDIKQDLQGNMWFATAGRGIFKLNTKTNQWENYRHRNSNKRIPSNQVNNLAISDNSNIWVATSNGLCLFDQQTNSFINYPLDIPSSNIKSIVEDGALLWLTTSRGLVLFNPSTGETQVYNRSDGLLSDEYLFGSALKATDGKIYLGTQYGFNSFNPNDIHQNRFIPPVVITSIEIHNRELKIDSKGQLTQSPFSIPEITLSHTDNAFSINYSALSYTAPEKNRYAYKLEGFDEEWNFVGSQTKTTYTNLPAGSYEFKVRACNNNGVWNNTGTSLTIVIKPAFFLNTAFKILYFIIITLIITLLMRWWVNRSERKHLEHIRAIEQNKEVELYNAKLHLYNTIADNIRTPVSQIIEPVEKIMAQKDTLPDNIVSNIEKIEHNSKQLLSLAEQMKNLNDK